MDLTEEIREEITMSGNIKKEQRIKQGMIQQKQKIQIKLKVIKYLNHSWMNLIQKI